MNCFKMLSDIERDCKLNAVHLPKQISSERDWRGISFKVGRFHGVCTMQAIAEVLPWPMITPLPSARSWFRGAANVRGRLLPVTDLQGFITGLPHQSGITSRVLVVHFKNHAYGFAVEQVLGIERFFGDEKKSAKALPDIEPYLPYVIDAFEHQEKPWILLDFEAIFQDAGFYHVLSARMEGGR
ncbi:MAG: chemotaxis protein CheW [Gammaproteobacteria bacterium]|nr:chemotaxis protein CheW [Gammaproteobacteria bacterium]